MPLASIAKILSLKNKTDLVAALNLARHLRSPVLPALCGFKLLGRKGPRPADTPGCGPLIRCITNERKGPLLWQSQRPLLRTTECLGDRWYGVTELGGPFVRLPG